MLTPITGLSLMIHFKFLTDRFSAQSCEVAESLNETRTQLQRTQFLEDKVREIRDRKPRIWIVSGKAVGPIA